jgi:hypothetical protein
MRLRTLGAVVLSMCAGTARGSPGACKAITQTNDRKVILDQVSGVSAETLHDSAGALELRLADLLQDAVPEQLLVRACPSRQTTDADFDGAAVTELKDNGVVVEIRCTLDHASKDDQDGRARQGTSRYAVLPAIDAKKPHEFSNVQVTRWSVDQDAALPDLVHHWANEVAGYVLIALGTNETHAPKPRYAEAVKLFCRAHRLLVASPHAAARDRAKVAARLATAAARQALADPRDKSALKLPDVKEASSPCGGPP